MFGGLVGAPLYFLTRHAPRLLPHVNIDLLHHNQLLSRPSIPQSYRQESPFSTAISEAFVLPAPTTCSSTSAVNSRLVFDPRVTALTSSPDGRKERVQFDKITARVSRLCYGLDPEHVDSAAITMKVISGVYQGVTTIQLDDLVRLRLRT